MREIPLTQGYKAIVDDDDFESLSLWKWCIHPSPSGLIYAARMYRVEKGKRRRIFMHHQVIGRRDGLEVDHINGCALDNRKSNLRFVTRSQNMWNRKANVKGASKYRGVSWHKQHQKWCVSIMVNKKKKHIGLFEDEIDAAKAYEKRAQIEFGEFYRSQKI